MGQSRGAPAGPARRVGVAVTALCLVQFMDVLGVTVVVTSLPAMLASLHAPDSLGSLIAAAGSRVPCCWRPASCWPAVSCWLTIAPPRRCCRGS